MASSNEVEASGLILNDQKAVALCTNHFCWLRHPQPPTAIKTESCTASDIVKKTLKQCKAHPTDLLPFLLNPRSHPAELVHCLLVSRQQKILVTILLNITHHHTTISCRAPFLSPPPQPASKHMHSHMPNILQEGVKSGPPLCSHMCATQHSNHKSIYNHRDSQYPIHY
jgi:hypothetical protein